MHPVTEAIILAALRDCYPPEIPLNIVDLGLVHAISIACDPNAPGAGIPGVPPRHSVAVALTLAQIVDPHTEDAEPEAAPLIAQIKNRLAAFETISRTEVTLLAEPTWTPDRITEEGRARLAHRLTSNKPASTKPDALVQIQIQPGKASA
jgi:metal-sulfur cluster biosynthetic enzyme